MCNGLTYVLFMFKRTTTEAEDSLDKCRETASGYGANRVVQAPFSYTDIFYKTFVPHFMLTIFSSRDSFFNSLSSQSCVVDMKVVPGTIN